MPKQFNAYHAWLGIPVEEQPPNHYRLLGIPLFESSDDVIQNGLDQRMAHVKSFTIGPHAAESQRLLKELSQAGVCLLRPEKKQAYDEKLKSALEGTEAGTNVCPCPASAPPSSVPASLRVVPRQPASLGMAASPTPSTQLAADGEGRPGRLSRSGFPLGPIVVGAAIGLGVACLVLLMLSRGKNPPQVATDRAAASLQGVAETSKKNGTLEAASVSAGGQPAMADLDAAPATASGSAPVNPVPSADVQPPAASPDTSAKSPGNPPNPFEATASQPATPMAVPAVSTPGAADPFSAAGNPTAPPVATPAVSAPATEAAGAATGTPPSTAVAGAPKSIVLDLERSSMFMTLAENAEGKEIVAQVQGITDLGTPYDMQPADGAIRMGKPVEILLTQYAGVKICLALRMRGKNADLEVSPEIETGQGKTSDFSKSTLDALSISTRKHAVALSKQFAGAQGEAVEIQKWLAAPVAKTVPLRNARVQRLSVLTGQVIPALQKQITDTQARMDLIQQLSRLVGQVNKKARLNLAVQVEPAAKAN